MATEVRWTRGEHSGLPEEHAYKDDACPTARRMSRFHCQPDFFIDRDGIARAVPGTGCPFPECMFGRDQERRELLPETLERRRRDMRVATLLRTMSVAQVVALEGISKRTVFRIQAQARLQTVSWAGRGGYVQENEALPIREEDLWLCQHCGRSIPKWDVQRHREGGRCNEIKHAGGTMKPKKAFRLTVIEGGAKEEPPARSARTA